MVSRSAPSKIAPPPAAGPLRRPTSLGDEVYSVLFAQIMSLQITPGARISIDTLARELGVSHTPVREALARLESERLIQKTHLLGYRAAPQLTRKQFADLYELRLLIEPHAAALAAQNISEEALERLASLSDEMTQSGSDTKAYGIFARLDNIFHDEIAHAAGNAYVESALSTLHTHVHLFRLVHHSEATREALKEHAAVVDALKHRDSARAGRAMHSHIMKSRSRFEPKVEGPG